MQAKVDEAILAFEDEAPVEEEIEDDNVEAIDEEKEYECIPSLLAQYQPSRSEILDH